jgi:hypothetical protein
MKNNKQKTAVSWFLDQLLKDGYIKRLPVLQLQQAKEMEKQQIIDAANTLLYAGPGPGDTWAEQYYKETYENEQ